MYRYVTIIIGVDGEIIFASALVHGNGRIARPAKPDSISRRQCMSQIKVKDVMIPLSKYPTISEDATLYEAVMALEDAHCKKTGPNYKYRALLVKDSKDRIVGKISHLSILHALEPQFQDIGDISMLTRHGLGPSFVRNITRDFELLQKPLDDVCKKAGKLTVRGIMHTPTKGEHIDPEATLNVAIHQLVIGQLQSLVVYKNDEVVGMLRLSDVYHAIMEMMKSCEVS